MPKAALEDRPIWPVAPDETPAGEGTPSASEAETESAPEDPAQPARHAADSFEGFGSFSG